MFVKPGGHAPSQRAALKENTRVFALRSLHWLRLNTPKLLADVLFSVDNFKTIFNPGALHHGCWPCVILIDPFLIPISKSTDGMVEGTHWSWSALVYKADLRIISDLFIWMNLLVCVRWKNMYRPIAPQGMSSWPEFLVCFLYVCVCVCVLVTYIFLSLLSVISRQSRKSLSV